MTGEAAPCGARIMAWLVVVLTAGLLVLGLAWYGFSVEVHQRIWRDIAERPGAPCRSASCSSRPSPSSPPSTRIRDARVRRTPYLRAMLRDPAERGDRLREGLFATARA